MAERLIAGGKRANALPWVDVARVHLLEALSALSKNEVNRAAEILADVLGHIKFHNVSETPVPGIAVSTKMGNLLIGGGWSLLNNRPGGSHVPAAPGVPPGWVPCKAGPGYFHESEEMRAQCKICNKPAAAPPEPLDTFSAPRVAGDTPKAPAAPTCPACGPDARVFRSGAEWVCAGCGSVIIERGADRAS